MTTGKRRLGIGLVCLAAVIGILALVLSPCASRARETQRELNLAEGQKRGLLKYARALLESGSKAAAHHTFPGLARVTNPVIVTLFVTRIARRALAEATGETGTAPSA